MIGCRSTAMFRSAHPALPVVVGIPTPVISCIRHDEALGLLRVAHLLEELDIEPATTEQPAAHLFPGAPARERPYQNPARFPQATGRSPADASMQAQGAEMPPQFDR